MEEEKELSTDLDWTVAFTVWLQAVVLKKKKRKKKERVFELVRVVSMVRIVKHLHARCVRSCRWWGSLC